MRIRIESDGTARNTRVVDARTGERLENVQAVSWWVYAGPDGPLTTATVTLCQVPLDAETEAVIRAAGVSDED